MLRMRKSHAALLAEKKNDARKNSVRSDLLLVDNITLSVFIKN